MQWTVEQIIAELAHLDTQVLSYLERARLELLGDEDKLKTVRRWFKAQSEVICIMLGEIHLNHGALHDEIVSEQDHTPRGYQGPHVERDYRPRDSMN